MKMGGSQQTKKQSPGRTGGGRLTPHTPPRHTHAHGRSGQTRHTPRSTQARTGAGRKQASHASQTHAHTLRSPSAQGSHARAEQGSCGLFCYLCYGGYCLCLTLLSLFLLLLLSPPTPRTLPPPPASSSAPLPPSPSDDTIFSLSFSSLAVPFCPHPSLNLSSFSMSPLSPLLSSTDSLTLLQPDSELFPFNLSTPLPPCPSASPAPPPTPSKSSSDPSPHPRPFVLVPPSLLLLPRPSLCRSRPSSRSLPSLLLCPHSLSDHALSSVETLDDIPSMGATPRPRTLLRQQSLQQPLIQAPAPNLASRPPNSQSLGQLHTQPGSGGGGGGAGSRSSRGGPAGGGASCYRPEGAGGRASRGNPGSVDHMMGQMKKRGLDVKSFL